MSKIQFEVKVFKRFNDELINTYTLSDERYDDLDEDKAMSLARNAVECTVPEECRFDIEKING